MKRTFKSFLLAFFAVFLICTDLSAAGAGRKAARDTVRILAIGNSFSQDAIEQNLYELAKADGIPVIIGNAYIGGCSLERHVNNSRSGEGIYAYRKIGVDGVKNETKKVSLPDIIADEQWDYVSLQQSSPFSGLYETYEKSLPELYGYVKARVSEKAKLILHQTWAYSCDSDHKGFANYDRDQMKMYNAIVEANRKAAKLVGIKIMVPSGTAIQNARTSIIGDNMTRDGYHLDLKWGRYTAACTWYEKIFGNVTGNTYAPEGVSDEYKAISQKAAHEAVRRPYVVTGIAE